MVIACIILEVLGWVLPVGSAAFALGKLYPKMPNPPVGRKATIGDVNQWMHHDLPDLFRDRRAALKWPALVAVIGLTSSTVASVLSLVYLTN